jgi:signal peptidase
MLTKWLLILGALLGLTVLSIGYLGSHSLFGLRAKVITSSSMQPALRTGSLLIIEQKLPQQYQAGDIVSFRAPTAGGIEVTHRITRVYRTLTGVQVMATKGDANANGDPWTTSIGAIEGKEVMSIPWIGYGLLFMQTPIGFLVVVLLTFLLFVYVELCHIFTSLHIARANLIRSITVSKGG